MAVHLKMYSPQHVHNTGGKGNPQDYQNSPLRALAFLQKRAPNFDNTRE